MKKRIVIAQMKHETNTFSPVPTPLARFARGQAEPYRGAEVVKAYRNTGSGIGAFIEIAEAEGFDYVTPIAGSAAPSGPVQQAAFETMAGEIVAAIEQGCDAAFLDLHGAMVTETSEDGEGELLARIRKAAPGLPVAVALDMHANIYPAIIDNATTVAGYLTYPHIDQHGTGLRAGRALVKALKGEAKPTMAWGNVPMLPHVMRQASEDLPNRLLQERCAAMEKEKGVLCASVFVGFPHADIVNAGLSAVIVTDGDLARAQALRDELLAKAWAERAAFVYEIEPLAQSIARAKAMAEGPVVLLDHYDNCASGGTMDSMTVIGAVLEAGLDNVAIFAVFDPQAVQAMIKAGVGSRVTLALGGRTDMPSIGLKGKPLTISGEVKAITNGKYRNRGPMSRGVLQDMGATAVLDTGQAEIIVVSRQVEPNDFECFAACGIDPTRKRYLLLKSRVHWRAGFKPIARGIVECAGTGVCTSDYSTLSFKKVRRPIYPLDRINDWRAGSA